MELNAIYLKTINYRLIFFLISTKFSGTFGNLREMCYKPDILGEAAKKKKKANVRFYTIEKID